MRKMKFLPSFLEKLFCPAVTGVWDGLLISGLSIGREIELSKFFFPKKWVFPKNEGLSEHFCWNSPWLRVWPPWCESHIFMSLVHFVQALPLQFFRKNLQPKNRFSRKSKTTKVFFRTFPDLWRHPSYSKGCFAGIWNLTYRTQWNFFL